LTSASITSGAPVQFGTFTGLGDLGLPSGIVLSTGGVVDAVPGASTVSGLGQGGGSFGAGFFDAAQLSFGFTSSTSSVSFSFIFASAEYSGYVNSTFNDEFRLLLNGQNIALVPGTSTPISINTINNGGPTAPGTNPSNAQFFSANPSHTTINFEGYTKLIEVGATNLIPGQSNTLSFAIADKGDSSLNSAVFITALSNAQPGSNPNAANNPGVPPTPPPTSGLLENPSVATTASYTANGQVATGPTGVAVNDLTFSPGASIAIQDKLTVTGNQIRSAAGTSGMITGGTLEGGSCGLQFNIDGVLVVQSNIGLGGVQKSGVGDLIVGGVNTYSCPTDVMSGALRATSTTGFSPNSAYTVSAGTELDVFGSNNTVGSLAGAGRVTNTALGAATLSVGALGTSTTFSGTIADGSAALGFSKVGSGRLAISGTSTHSGSATIDAGVLAAGSASAFSPNSAYTVNGGASLDLGGFNNTTASLAGSGSLTNSGSSAAALTTGGNNASTTFSGTIADGAASTGLTKTGTGRFVVAGASTHSGATTVVGGTLAAGSTTGFSANSALAIAGGATVDLAGFSNTTASISGAGSLINGGGQAAVLTTGGNNASATFSGVIADGSASTGLTKVGTGTLVSAGVATHSGPTAVMAGTFAAGSATGFSANSPIAVSAGATLDLAGFDNTTASVEGGGTLTNSGGQSAALTTGGNNASTTFSGGIVDGASPTALTKVGSGRLVSAGIASNSGATTVLAGVLSAGSTTGFSANSPYNVGAGAALDLAGFNNGVGSLSGAGALTNSGTQTAALTTGANNATTVFAGSLADGTAQTGLVKTGTGTFVSAGTATHSAPTVVQSGVLAAGSTTGLSPNSALQLASNSAVDLAGFSNTAGSLAGAGIVTNSGQQAATLKAGADNTSTTFSGSVRDGAAAKTGITKEGAGKMVLSGANTNSGDTTVSAGTLAAGSTSAFSPASGFKVMPGAVLDLAGNSNTTGSLAGAGTLVNNGAVAAKLTTGASNASTEFAGRIADGTSATAFEKVGSGVLISSGIASNSGDTTVAAGVLAAGSTTGFSERSAYEVKKGAALDMNGYDNKTGSLSGSGLVTNTGGKAAVLTTGANNASTTFDGVLSDGNAALGLTKEGTGELKIFGDNPYTMPTEVRSGSLILNGSVASAQVAVHQRAMLAGNARIRGDLLNEGIVSPGNSPGTVTIGGNFIQSPGGTLLVEIAGPQSFDRLVVGGAAMLDGSIKLEPFGGYGFNYGDEFFNVISTGKGTFGRFRSIIVPDGFRLRLLDDGFNISFVLAPADYTTLAQTPSQESVASALNEWVDVTTGDPNTVITAVDVLASQEYPAAFAAISPDFYRSLSTIVFNVSNNLNGDMQQRFAAIRAGSVGFAADHVAAQAPDGKEFKGSKDVVVEEPDSNWGSFVQGNGIFAKVPKISDIPSYRFASGGVTAGLDYRVAPGLAVGVYSGYQGTQANYENSGLLIDNGVRFGLYSTYQNGGFYTSALVGGAYHAFQVRRTIQFSSVDRSALSKPDGWELDSLLELGYNMRFGKWSIGPFTNLQYTYLGIPPFVEGGADALDLSVAEQNANSLRYTLGGQVSYTWDINSKISVVPGVSIAWQHEFLDGARTIDATLDGGDGPAVAGYTPGVGKDNVFATASVSINIGRNFSTTLSYTADFGAQDFVSNAISAGLNFGF